MIETIQQRFNATVEYGTFYGWDRQPFEGVRFVFIVDPMVDDVTVVEQMFNNAGLTIRMFGLGGEGGGLVRCDVRAEVA